MNLTRRERHERIIRAFPADNYTVRSFFLERRLSTLSDDAMEELARAILSDHRFSQMTAERNRKYRQMAEAAQ